MSKISDAMIEIEHAILCGYSEAAAWADDIDTDSPEWCEHAEAAVFKFCYGDSGSRVLSLFNLGDCRQECAGHDLWLTRQGHGSGFWDRDAAFYGSAEIRDAMDAAARALGEVYECFDYIEGSERWCDEQEARAAE